MARAWRIARAWLWAPVWLPWLVFAGFWEWWHFGPSQTLLRAGRALDNWIGRRVQRAPDLNREEPHD